MLHFVRHFFNASHNSVKNNTNRNIGSQAGELGCTHVHIPNISEFFVFLSKYHLKALKTRKQQKIRILSANVEKSWAGHNSSTEWHIFFGFI